MPKDVYGSSGNHTVQCPYEPYYIIYIHALPLYALFINWISKMYSLEFISLLSSSCLLCISNITHQSTQKCLPYVHFTIIRNLQLLSCQSIYCARSAPLDIIKIVILRHILETRVRARVSLYLTCSLSYSFPSSSLSFSFSSFHYKPKHIK